MIERYSLPEMAAVWSDEHRLDLWQRIEVLVVEAWVLEGIVPASTCSPQPWGRMATGSTTD